MTDKNHSTATDSQTWVWTRRCFPNHHVLSSVDSKWIDKFHLPKHKNPFLKSGEKTWINSDPAGNFFVQVADEILMQYEKYLRTLTCLRIDAKENIEKYP